MVSHRIFFMFLLYLFSIIHPFFFSFLRVLKVLLRGAKKICNPPWRRKPYVVKPPWSAKITPPLLENFLHPFPAKISLPTYASLLYK